MIDIHPRWRSRERMKIRIVSPSNEEREIETPSKYKIPLRMMEAGETYFLRGGRKSTAYTMAKEVGARVSLRRGAGGYWITRIA